MRKSKEKKFYARIFGAKIGDIVKLKYGKVYWEIWKEEAQVSPTYNNYEKRFFLRRWRKVHGWTRKEIYSHCNESWIIEVTTKEAVQESFPSDMWGQLFHGK